MRIAVLNFSGNVGKTTISRHCLTPRLDDCFLCHVETINEGGNDSNVRGRDFKEVLEDIMIHKNAVVDIGSSNIESVFTQLKLMQGSHEDFDYYVVPVVPVDKQQIDTGKILLELMGLGIEPNKIRVILNQVDPELSIEKKFAPLIPTLTEYGIAYNAIIHINEVYPLLGKDMTIDEAISEGTDFSAKIANTQDPNEIRDLAKARGISRLAKSAKLDLDKAFKALFAG